MENMEPAKAFDEEGVPVKKLRYRKKDLRIACEKGDLDRLKDLVARGVSVDACDKAYKTALMYACENGHYEIVDFLLEHNASFDAQEWKGWTALIHACKNGHYEIVDFLLEHNASFDAQDRKGWTALIHACDKNRKDIVELLMKHGADINEKKYYCGNKGPEFLRGKIVQRLNNRENALILACGKGYMQIVELLIDYKADVEFLDENQNTILMHAIESGHKELIEFLLSTKVDINQKNKHNNTALLIACKTCDQDIVKLLLESGADLSAMKKKMDCYEGKTPLAVACSNDKFDIAKLLISYGCDIFTEDYQGRTLLMHATECGSLQMVKYFIGKGVDMNEPNIHGKTPLMSACSKGNMDIVELLIKEGADIKKKTFEKSYLKKEKKSVVNSLKGALSKVAVALALKTEKRGTTALIFASTNGHADIVDLLVKRGANVNAIDFKGETALIHAAKNKHVKVVQRLIESGSCDVNFGSNTRGVDDALRCCCLNGSTEIAKILLANGAKPCLKDYLERSPFWYAVMPGHFEIVELMVKNYPVDLDGNSLISKTALMVACEEGWDNIVDLLLKHGANPELFCGHSELNPLSFSLSHAKSIKCFELLVDYGVNLDTPSGHVFSQVIKKSNFKALEILAKSTRLVQNGRLSPNCYEEPAWNDNSKTMALLVGYGLFEWCIIPDRFHRYSVITNAISLGICPGKVKNKHGQYCSLFSFISQRQLKYQETLVLMLENLYFYPEDYPHLLQLEERLENPPDYLVDFLSEPLTLEKWSFLAVSQAVALAGPPYLRWNRVNALSIPVIWKRKLVFGNDKVFD